MKTFCVWMMLLVVLSFVSHDAVVRLAASYFMVVYFAMPYGLVLIGLALGIAYCTRRGDNQWLFRGFYACTTLGVALFLNLRIPQLH